MDTSSTTPTGTMPNTSSTNPTQNQLQTIKSLLQRQLQETEAHITRELEAEAEADRRRVVLEERHEAVEGLLDGVRGLAERRRGDARTRNEGKDEGDLLMQVLREAHDERMGMVHSFIVGCQEQANARHRRMLEEIAMWPGRESNRGMGANGRPQARRARRP